MQPYNFKVKYKSGANNIADSLSRLLSKNRGDSKHAKEAEEYVRFVAILATPNGLQHVKSNKHRPKMKSSVKSESV